jgi:hypothetical protein
MQNDKYVVLIGVYNYPDDFELVPEVLKKYPDVRFEFLKNRPKYLAGFGLIMIKNC